MLAGLVVEHLGCSCLTAGGDGVIPLLHHVQLQFVVGVRRRRVDDRLELGGREIKLFKCIQKSQFFF